MTVRAKRIYDAWEEEYCLQKPFHEHRALAAAFRELINQLQHLLVLLCVPIFLNFVRNLKMSKEKLNLIIAALTTLSVETDVDADDIVEALVGLCWDEEDGSLIESTIRGVY